MAAHYADRPIAEPTVISFPLLIGPMYSGLWEFLEGDEATGVFTVEYPQHVFSTVFFFSDERTAMLFRLRFG